MNPLENVSVSPCPMLKESGGQYDIYMKCKFEYIEMLIYNNDLDLIIGQKLNLDLWKRNT